MGTDQGLPVTHFACSGDVNIAYQVIGKGPPDLVLVPGTISHVEFLHEMPGYTDFLRQIATYARVVTFDKRGQGLSDRVLGPASLEQRMDDVRAIMDAIGSERIALLGFSEGSAMSALFAATWPERVSKLILWGGYSKEGDLPDLEERLNERVRLWGTGSLIKKAQPELASDPEAIARMAKFERLSASPGTYKEQQMLNSKIDVRSILPSIRVPTLVLHRQKDVLVPCEHGRGLAAAIPGARYIEYPEGTAHAPWIGNSRLILGDIEEFIMGQRGLGIDDPDRFLATVLFTDIVNSTERAAQLGDRDWRNVLNEHDEVAAQMVKKYRGVLIKNTGDGILATFDGPGRAIRCALELRVSAHRMNLRVRAGLHTGEIEKRGADVGGIAVHAAARVMSHAAPDEVLVSRVVTDLVAGAGLRFAHRGPHEFKGLPGRWDLFAANI